MSDVTVTLAILGIIVGAVYMAIIGSRRKTESMLEDHRVIEAIRLQERSDLIDTQLVEIEKSLEARKQKAKEVRDAYEKINGPIGGTDDSDDSDKK